MYPGLNEDEWVLVEEVEGDFVIGAGQQIYWTNTEFDNKTDNTIISYTSMVKLFSTGKFLLGLTYALCGSEVDETDLGKKVYKKVP
jgi:hypothetical protein